MGARDQGWVQIYSENAQESYENTLLAVRLAEKVLLPVMVCQDGFITSHGVENVAVYDDNKVKSFVGELKPYKPLLDVDDPVTYGPLQLTDYYFETKRQQEPAMEEAKKAYQAIGKELKKITGNDYGYFEEYQLKDAKAAIVVLNSTAGTTKAVIDKLRQKGKKVGLLKIKLFRPFPYEEVGRALKNISSIAVLDRSESFGANAPVFGEIKNALYDAKSKAKLHSCIFGLGGRNIYEKDIEDLFSKLLTNKLKGKEYIGVR